MARCQVPAEEEDVGVQLPGRARAASGIPIVGGWCELSGPRWGKGHWSQGRILARARAHMEGRFPGGLA